MNPNNTFAFLIAIENYTKDQQLHRLPHSFNNVAALHKILKGSSAGIPKTNIQTDFDSDNATELIEKMQDHVKSGDAKTLIIYYAGHGVLDDDGSHYLSLSNSTVDNIAINGLDIGYLNKAFSGNKNLNIILILDSCFSENAFENFSARNYLVIASSAKNRTSKYPVEADYSAFTNELINIFKNGIDTPEDTLTWRDIYSQLKINLKERGFPQPRITSQNEVDALQATKNTFHDAEVNMDDQWVKVIKEDMGKNNPKFRERVIGILNSGSPQIVNKLKEQLLNNFPYPIAFYLNKVFDKDPSVSTYTQLYESSIRFLCMVIIIQYETIITKNGFSQGNKFRQLILDFDSPDDNFYSEMLEAISEEFKINKVKSFLNGFDYLSEDFQAIVKSMEKLKKEENPDMGKLRNNCFKLVTQLDFLLNYKLLSIKDVNLNFRKYDNLNYNHSVSILQGTGHTQYEVWDELTEDWQKSFVRNKTAKNNRSVILVDCSHSEDITYLNMWPMVIDKNVLDQKASTPEVYLYSGEDDDENYMYQNIRDTEVLAMKTYNQLEAYAATGNINMFKERLIHGPKKSD